MDLLNSIITKRKKQLKGQLITLTAEEEQRKKEEYIEKQKIIDKEEEVKLGKRLQKLEDFYDYAKLKIKKVKSKKKEQPKTEVEKKYEEGMKKIDTTKRDVSKLDMEINQENIDKLMEHNAKFLERFDNIEDKNQQLTKVDASKDVEYDDMCDDVLYFVQKILREWEVDLNSKPSNWEKSLEGRKANKLFKETKRNFLNLYEVLMNRTCNNLILVKFYHIAHFCLLKEYVRANSNYMDLAIGNAPWPIGVTMVGIHERSGRAKIFTSQIAHIMNDEAQKLYVQSFKRLITFCQKKNPTIHSKMVRH